MNSTKELPRCSCGENHTGQFDKPTRRFLRRTIKRQGRLQLVTTPSGTWRVPRIYIAAHGLKAEEVPALAELYSWTKEGK